eukprot:Skav223199  [mRNA]  locus=scaffold1624:30124:30972:- [translate_table: standard]
MVTAVNRCAWIYGAEAVQCAVQQNIVSAAAANGTAEGTSPAAGYAAPLAPAALVKCIEETFQKIQNLKEESEWKVQAMQQDLAATQALKEELESLISSAETAQLEVTQLKKLLASFSQLVFQLRNLQLQAQQAAAAQEKLQQIAVEDSSNWVDDWTVTGGNLLDGPSEAVNLSPVVQGGDGNQVVAPVPSSKPQEDLAEIFPATCRSQAVRRTPSASERCGMATVPLGECQLGGEPARGRRFTCTDCARPLCLRRVGKTRAVSGQRRDLPTGRFVGKSLDAR